MKRTVTSLFSAACALMLGISCFSVGTNAAVIEPEIVKTETWTTSYYIDDDMETLYPYVQCQADIYNDGTIKLYLWNTHEWGGSSPIQQNVTFCQYTRMSPVSDQDYDFDRYLLSGDGWCESSADSIFILNPAFEAENELVRNIDRNLHPSSYSLEINNKLETIFGSEKSGNPQYAFLYCQRIESNSKSYSEQYCYSRQSVAIALAKMAVYNQAEDTNLLATYHPLTEVTNTHNFHLFGHDITITPELLSGKVVAEPELTEHEKYIKQLEEENTALKAQLAAVDYDADGLLTAADAQMLLVYYTDYLAGTTSGKTADYAQYIQNLLGK